MRGTFKVKLSYLGNLFHDTSNILCPNEIKHNKVFKMLTDVASYMVETPVSLTLLFPNMI